MLTDRRGYVTAVTSISYPQSSCTAGHLISLSLCTQWFCFTRWRKNKTHYLQVTGRVLKQISAIRTFCSNMLVCESLGTYYMSVCVPAYHHVRHPMHCNIATLAAFNRAKRLIFLAPSLKSPPPPPPPNFSVCHALKVYVRPSLEFATTVWSPSLKKDI